ncbi:hypothetical protein AVEN_174406-1 [Araneus ventricosus]|uniref:Nucleic-acid-binding protein from transposon X-element n=1 Tax=Araneus ventricosus TaxID=182803 RepID=A0A4Y2H2U9_ARAVE|nr:hypothetical protein AVEN_174406-1 [Araneus ventricosus]
MCYRSQDYFHHSSRCTGNSRCMKCAGNHQSKDFPKPTDTPSTCLHCTGNHTPNFMGCPKNPLNRKSFLAASINIWSDPKALAKVKESPNQDTALKPATQFVPRSVQHSQKLPSNQEAFFN